MRRDDKYAKIFLIQVILCIKTINVINKLIMYNELTSYISIIISSLLKVCFEINSFDSGGFSIRIP